MKPAIPLPQSIRLGQSTLLDGEADDARFLSYARSMSAGPPGAVLLSGGHPPTEGESRYSIAACDPFLTFTSKGLDCCVRSSHGSFDIHGSPLDVLDELIDRLHWDYPLEVPPFSGGAIGYFAYDLKNVIERLPQTARDDLGLPDIFLFWPRQILVHDRIAKSLHYLSLDVDGLEGPRHSALAPSPPDAQGTGEAHGRPVSPGCCGIEAGALASNFTRAEYVEAVRRVRHYIREGDVYQVNLSQRYRFSFRGDPFELWKSLFELNPAPFYAFIQAGSHQVLSTSMERFLYQRGPYIETRPIKGTRKRGGTPQEDRALMRELLESPKDDAELSMIVDLLRNDLGRVCLPRTVRVAQHKRLESYQNVHHLVSMVTGELRPETTYGRLLRATFPGGSITGCPKVRTMEIIDELEPNVRHVYTGSIGYLGCHGNLDLNIAIRTALVHQGACYFSVGGGIVHDSVEEEEYEETLHKGRSLFQTIEKSGAVCP